MSLCSCNDNVKNFGQPNCVGILERPQKLAFTYRVANDGTLNKIVTADTLDDTYFTALINETDLSKRLIPSPDINKVADIRGENNTFEVDGFKINTSKGVRTLAFTVVDGASPQIAEAFESMGCRDMAFYSWTVSGQIGGNGSVAGELRPFRIKKNTMRVVYNPPSKDPETPAMVMVSFDLSELEKDADIAYINYGTGANDVQVIITDYTGLIDITMNAATGITTTVFIVDIDFIYGPQLDKSAAEGFVLADFTLAEISPTPGALAITSVTESLTVPGRYTFVTPARTSADVHRLTFAKDGYEAASTIDITTP